MKNISFYRAEKYKDDIYKEVEENIYETKHINKSLFPDKEIIFQDNWEKTDEFVMFNGKKYWKSKNEPVVKKMIDRTKKYVTSLSFEPEPEFGEKQRHGKIDQYPLEDILEKFGLWVNDCYDQLNEEDKKLCYLEFASEDIEDIRNLKSIVGKHVYNKYVYDKDDDRTYVDLIIE